MTLDELLSELSTIRFGLDRGDIEVLIPGFQPLDEEGERDAVPPVVELFAADTMVSVDLSGEFIPGEEPVVMILPKDDPSLEPDEDEDA